MRKIEFSLDDRPIRKRGLPDEPEAARVVSKSSKKSATAEERLETGSLLAAAAILIGRQHCCCYFRPSGWLRRNDKFQVARAWPHRRCTCQRAPEKEGLDFWHSPLFTAGASLQRLLSALALLFRLRFSSASIAANDACPVIVLCKNEAAILPSDFYEWHSSIRYRDTSPAIATSYALPVAEVTIRPLLGTPRVLKGT